MMLLALAARFGMDIMDLDVVSAFAQCPVPANRHPSVVCCPIEVAKMERQLLLDQGMPLSKVDIECPLERLLLMLVMMYAPLDASRVFFEFFVDILTRPPLNFIAEVGG